MLVPETPPLPASATQGKQLASLTPPLPPPALGGSVVVGETPPQSQGNTAAASPEYSQIYVRRRSIALAHPPLAPAPGSSLFSPSSPAVPRGGRGRLRALTPALLSPESAGKDVVGVSSGSSSAGSCSAWDDECGVCGEGEGELLCCEGGGGCTAVFHKACIG